MALLETYPVGTTVRVGVSSITYKIVHIGNPDPSLYDPSCDGIWMWQYSPMPSRRWNYQYNKSYASSEINEYMQAMSLGEELDKTIKWVKIPYAEGEASTVVYSGAEGLSTQWFLLSAREIGTDNSSVHIDGAKLDYFEEGNTETANVKRILNTSESNAIWWTRTPIRGNSTAVYDVLSSGSINATNCTNRCYVAPAFILPYNRILVNDDGTLTVKPPATVGELSAEYDTAGRIQIPFMDGTTKTGIIVNQGIPGGSDLYDTSCDGTWVMFEDCIEKRSLDAEGVNDYENSDIHLYLNGDFYLTLSEPFKNTIKQIKIPYVNGIGGSPIASGTNGLATKIFLASGYEMGWDQSVSSYFPIDGAKLSYFPTGNDSILSQRRSAYLDGALESWWLRSPYAVSGNNASFFAWKVWGSGTNNYEACNNLLGVRPVFILPKSTPILPLADGTYAVAPTMPKTTGELPVGALVNAQFADGTTKPCIAVNQGLPSDLYDVSCNGTWMLFKDCTEKRAWNSTNVNNYENSTIHAYLNGEFADKLDGEFLKNVLQAKIPYRPGSGISPTVNSGANGLSCKVFLPSGYEMGWTSSDNQYFPPDGAKLSYFTAGTSSAANNKRIAYLNGSATSWWLRSPSTNSPGSAFVAYSDGDYRGNGCSSTYGVRPAFVLPLDLPVEMQEDGSFNIVPNRNTARVIVDGVETPAASSVIVAGVETPCACSKIVNGVETPCI